MNEIEKLEEIRLELSELNAYMCDLYNLLDTQIEISIKNSQGLCNEIRKLTQRLKTGITINK